MNDNDILIASLPEQDVIKNDDGSVDVRPPMVKYDPTERFDYFSDLLQGATTRLTEAQTEVDNYTAEVEKWSKLLPEKTAEISPALEVKPDQPLTPND